MSEKTTAEPKVDSMAGSAWIIVTDRLPEIGELVQVYNPRTKRVTAAARYVRHETDLQHWWDAPTGGACTPGEFISHWQPMALAPNEKDDLQERSK